MIKEKKLTGQLCLDLRRREKMKSTNEL